MTLRGIDLSSYQGTVEWGRVATATGFVLIRATHYPGSPGSLAVDSQYARNIAGARVEKMLCGAYHYPGGADPVREADYFVDHANRRDGEWQMLDFEGHILSVADPVGWAKAWLDRVWQRTHNRPAIYMSESTVSRFNWARVVAGNYALVVAKWGSTAPSSGRWPYVAVWQDTDHQPTAGCNGTAPDGDIFNGDRAAWLAIGHTDLTPIVRPPVPPAPPVTVPQPPRPPAPIPSLYVKYEVKRGDTLSSIAEAHHCSWQFLQKLNHLSNPNLIFVDQVLSVPRVK